MRPRNSDPTAGETARATALNPAASRPIGDPTSPRYGAAPLMARVLAGGSPRIVDPTDPACGEGTG